jgi:hypothetical protein
MFKDVSKINLPPWRDTGRDLANSKGGPVYGRAKHLLLTDPLLLQSNRCVPNDDHELGVIEALPKERPQRFLQVSLGVVDGHPEADPGTPAGHMKIHDGL